MFSGNEGFRWETEDRYLRGIEIRAQRPLPSALDLLDLRCNAVDEELDAGNEAAVIGGEQDDCLGVWLRLPRLRLRWSRFF